MKWLETPQNEGERLLREGLDQAQKRVGDEISHRRVWAKIIESLEWPRPRRTGRLVFAGAGLLVLVTAGVVAYPHLSQSSRSRVANQPVKGKAPLALSAATTGKTAGSVAATASTTDPNALIEEERSPGHFVRTSAGERARVALGGGAEAQLAENSAITWDNQQRPSIEKGSAQLTVPHQPPGWRFSVTAGPYLVTVVGTRFEVRVESRAVDVDVSEGVVEVRRGSHMTRLVAGDSWHGPLYPDEVQTQPAATQPAERPLVSARPTMPTSRGVQEAQKALQAGDANKAVEILTRAAQGSGPAAENAAYELGRITRYNLNRPRQAVALWDKYRNRFPNGLLRTEADLSIVDTLSKLGDARAALAEADAFLARHPGSERRPEVQKLAERLRAAESAAEQR